MWCSCTRAFLSGLWPLEYGKHFCLLSEDNGPPQGSVAFCTLCRFVPTRAAGLLPRSSGANLTCPCAETLQKAKAHQLKVYYYTAAVPQYQANACALVGIFQVLYMDRSAMAAFETVQPMVPEIAFRDASCTVNTFPLTVLDVIQASGPCPVQLKTSVHCRALHCCRLHWQNMSLHLHHQH